MGIKYGTFIKSFSVQWKSSPYHFMNCNILIAFRHKYLFNCLLQLHHVTDNSAATGSEVEGWLLMIGLLQAVGRTRSRVTGTCWCQSWLHCVSKRNPSSSSSSFFIESHWQYFNYYFVIPESILIIFGKCIVGKVNIITTTNHLMLSLAAEYQLRCC